MKKIFEKAARDYINSDKFPVIGYPHLAFGDFIKGAEFAQKEMEKRMYAFLESISELTGYDSVDLKSSFDEFIKDFKED